MKTRMIRSVFTWLGVLSVLVVTTSLARASDRPDDETISFWVTEALRDDPRIDAADVRVAADEGIVTLSGTVKDIAAKRLASLEAQKIDGVRGIIDALVVEPVKRSDGDIQDDVLRRFENDSLLRNASEVKIAVKNGIVSLLGQAHSLAELEEASLVAGEVAGVRAIDAELSIARDEYRPDETVKRDVLIAFENDVYLSDCPVNVMVDDGKVTLIGAVSSVFEKERAANEAWWTPGVKGVDTKIEVIPIPDNGTRGSAAIPTDAEIQRAVLDVLAKDLRMDSDSVTVSVRNGAVELRGDVPTYYQKQIALTDGLNVVGVAAVTNLLGVSERGLNDADILDAVQLSFDSDYALRGQDLGVSVHDGVAVLAGEVSSFWLKAHAREAAARAAGVRDIVDNISLAREDSLTDTVIKTRIVDRLAHNAVTKTVANRVGVTVERGKATLMGEVDSWSERHAAERVAFVTDGVWAVDSRIHVKGADSNGEARVYQWPEAYRPDVQYPDYTYGLFGPKD